MTSIHLNVGAQAAQNGMKDSNASMNEAMNRLSTGLRINSAADDAAGSAIASKMESQTRSLGVAIRNANDAISLTQTAEGALGEVENILQRMRELAVQAGNSSLNDSDRAQIQAEVDALANEVDSISAKTNFNKVNLFDGSNTSVTMQIGVDATDTLAIALQKTNVDSLGIGTSKSHASLTSERIGAITANIAVADIKINGENFSAAEHDMDSTTFNNARGSTDANAFGDGNRSDNGGSVAGTMAARINSNSHVHGASASAFNKVVGTAGVFALTGNVTINDVTVTASSSTTKQAFVDAVNLNVAGLTAEISANDEIVLSNTTGDEIKIAGTTDGEFGIADDTYGGFIRISNLDGSDVKIEAGNELNGYGSSAAGTVADVNSLGFNEITGSTVTSAAVSSTALTVAHGIKVNDVAIGTSASASAADKAIAINSVTSQTGVTASAKTVAKIVLSDLNNHTMSDSADATFQGITVDMTNVDDLAEMVTAINNGIGASTDVVASSDADGNLILTSASGQDIVVNDGDAGAMFASASNLDGTNADTDGVFTIRGELTLTSTDGFIKLDDGEDGETNTGLGHLGLQAQSEQASTVTEGLSVGSVAKASASLTSIDNAITTISTFRAGFGATENRLDAAIANLTTYKTNLEAAAGRIVDADFAAETSNLTKAQILQQAATSMLAQANASKQGLLALLQG